MTLLLAMEEFGAGWATVRLIIALAVGAMGVISVAKISPGRPIDPDEQKALIWIFGILSIAAYIFITAVITISAVLAVLFLVSKLAPIVSQWLHTAKTDLSRELTVWSGSQPDRSPLPTGTEDMLREAHESGDPEVLKETVEWVLRNGNPSGNNGSRPGLPHRS